MRSQSDRHYHRVDIVLPHRSFPDRAHGCENNAPDSVKYLGHHLTNDLHYDLDNVVPLMFVETFFSGNFTCVVYR